MLLESSDPRFIQDVTQACDFSSFCLKFLKTKRITFDPTCLKIIYFVRGWGGFLSLIDCLITSLITALDVESVIVAKSWSFSPALINYLSRWKENCREVPRVILLSMCLSNRVSRYFLACHTIQNKNVRMKTCI